MVALFALHVQFVRNVARYSQLAFHYSQVFLSLP